MKKNNEQTARAAYSAANFRAAAALRAAETAAENMRAAAAAGKIAAAAQFAAQIETARAEYRRETAAAVKYAQIADQIAADRDRAEKTDRAARDMRAAADRAAADQKTRRAQFDFTAKMCDIMQSDKEYGAFIQTAAQISANAVCKYVAVLNAPAAMVQNRDTARREIAAIMHARAAIDKAETADQIARIMRAEYAAAAAKTDNETARAEYRAAQMRAAETAAAVENLRGKLFATVGADMISAAAVAILESIAAAPPTADQTAADYMSTPRAEIGGKAPRTYANAAARLQLKRADQTADQIAAAVEIGLTETAPEYNSDQIAAAGYFAPVGMNTDQTAENAALIVTDQTADQTDIFTLIDQTAAAAALTETETETARVLCVAGAMRAAAPIVGVSHVALIKRRRRIADKLTAAAAAGKITGNFAAAILTAAEISDKAAAQIVAAKRAAAHIYRLRAKLRAAETAENADRAAKLRAEIADKIAARDTAAQIVAADRAAAVDRAAQIIAAAEKTDRADQTDRRRDIAAQIIAAAFQRRAGFNGNSRRLPAPPTADQIADQTADKNAAQIADQTAENAARRAVGTYRAAKLRADQTAENAARRAQYAAEIAAEIADQTDRRAAEIAAARAAYRAAIAARDTDQTAENAARAAYRAHIAAAAHIAAHIAALRAIADQIAA